MGTADTIAHNSSKPIGGIFAWLFAAPNIASSTKKKVSFNYPGGAGCHVDCAPDSAGNCRNPGRVEAGGAQPEGEAAGSAAVR